MSSFTPDDYSAQSRFDELVTQTRYGAATREGGVENAIDLWRLCQQGSCPDSDSLSIASVAILKEMRNKVWKEPTKPTLNVIEGRSDFYNNTSPIPWDEISGSLHSKVAEIRFEKATRRKEKGLYFKALQMGNVTNAEDLLKAERTKYKFALGTKKKLDFGCCKKLQSLRKKVWADPLLHKVGSLPEDVAVLVHVGSCVGGETKLDTACRKRYRLQAEMEKCRRDWIEDSQEEDKPPYQVLSLSKNMNTVRFFDINSSATKETALRQEGQALFPNYDHLVELIHHILVDRGDCQLPLTAFADNVLLSALFTKHPGPQQSHRDYEGSGLFGRRVKGRTIQDGPLPGEPFPWSADIPLAGGGMNLNLWHGFQTNGRFSRDNVPLENWNIELHVPDGWMLLWRGDLVHAGGLLNTKGDGALRVHWYLPMKSSDAAGSHGKFAMVSRKIDVSGGPSGSGEAMSLPSICWIRDSTWQKGTKRKRYHR